jgi:hypothetical protein
VTQREQKKEEKEISDEYMSERVTELRNESEERMCE